MTDDSDAGAGGEVWPGQDRVDEIAAGLVEVEC